MTETTKSPDRLLFEAAKIARFALANGWPDEFMPGSLAALMAGGSRDEHKEDYKFWAYTINAALKADKLKARTEQPPPVTVKRDAGGLSERQRFIKALIPVSDGVRTRLVYSETHTPPPQHYINRTACGAWLLAIGAPPSEHVRAWLGLAPGASKGPSKVESKKAKIRAILAAIAELDPKFSPDAMPGQKADFFKLCQELDLA